MNIYLLNRTDKWDYDDFDSMVYVANTGEEAIDMSIADHSSGWPSYEEDISYEKIGVANDDMQPGLVIGSFNAG